MKLKLLNTLLILTSLFGYLEWGKGNSTFLFQAEADIFLKFINDASSVIHPFVVIPFIGQVLLFSTLFQNKPSKKFTIMGIGSIGILLVFMFVIGIISFNIKILLSTMPFLVIAFLAIQYHRNK